MPKTWRKITVLAVLMLLCFISACQSRREQKQGGVVVAYDDARSLRDKCHFARKHLLRGVMYWDYHGDDSLGTLQRTVWEAVH